MCLGFSFYVLTERKIFLWWKCWQLTLTIHISQKNVLIQCSHGATGGSVNHHTGRKPYVNWYGGSNIAYFCDIFWSNVFKYIYIYIYIHLAMLIWTVVYVQSMGDFEMIVKWHGVRLRGGCRPFKDSLSHSMGLLRVPVGNFLQCLGFLLAK